MPSPSSPFQPFGTPIGRYDEPVLHDPGPTSGSPDAGNAEAGPDPIEHEAFLREAARVGRQELAGEARRALAKGFPRVLSWLAPDTWPAVVWEDDGLLVDPVLLQGLVASAWGQGRPEPTPLAWGAGRLLGRAGREAWGRRLLESWMAWDTRPRHAYDEALAEVQAEFARLAPADFERDYPGLSPAQAFRHELDRLLRECEGSALEDRGVLAVAAACCGADAVPPVRAYLEKWRGPRAAQCRHLLAMVSWLEHPMALELLQEVARTGRSRSLQLHADRMLGAVARRRGWRLDELADRSLPDGGFERSSAQARPRLLLDFGPRQFLAHLDDRARIVLSGPDGRRLASLPSARKSDVPDLARQARERLARARAEVKGALEAGARLLQEAMWSQRAWWAADWEALVQRHPIAGIQACSLVWGVEREAGERLAFRPLDDGSLSTVDDDELRLAPGDRVRVAHACTVDPAEVAEWGTHFRDYRVTPLFAQFERAPFRLPPERRAASCLDDFRGREVGTLRLRAQAARQGFVRGPVSRAGWFHEYRRTLPGLGLELLLRFSGTSLAEEDRTVALVGVEFRRLVAGGTFPGRDLPRVPLGEVPPVLLSEAWHDLRAIALEEDGPAGASPAGC